LTWSKGTPFDLSMVLKFIKYKIGKAQPAGREWLQQMQVSLVAHKAAMDCATTGLQYAFGKNPVKVERRHFSHHRTHADAAAFASPYQEGVCVVLDGMGETSSIAAYDFRHGKLTKIDGVKAFPASLGVFYSMICDICGFDSLKGEEWKVMGMASYGKFDQKIYDIIRPLITVKGTTLKTSLNAFKIHRKLYDMRRMPGVPALEYADFAATAQFIFTETVHQLLRNIYDLHISENLILSGGCALNSSTNGTIVENTPFKEVFIGSAPADDGNAIGAAYRAYWKDHPDFQRTDGVLSPYLGSSIKESSLAKLRKYSGFRSQQLDEETLVRTVAQALANGKLVGWAQGRAEFGPRALGNRSILADPRSKDVKERLNAEVKFREEFRPFAPSILHEYGDDYFVNYQFSPYMERTLRFKEAVKSRVPGVVHVDGTGRLQSVTRKANPLYYRLIKAFHDITGVPILLNTSFNVMGKPIIHGVEDAVGVFQCSGLDVLVIDNTVFFKEEEAMRQPTLMMVGEEAVFV
ncbi:MAG: nodulation protein nolNO, partial [Acidobacteria bacterium]|nr:nodulation protein nolNO [Acidobacteriota bacterium]